MIQMDPEVLQVVGGFLMLAVLFVLRELVSGVLKEAGKELWVWARRHRKRSQGAQQPYRIVFDAVVDELNAFWQRMFAEAGSAYCAPTVKTLVTPVVTACGPASPARFAFYCPAEETIYYAPAGLEMHRQLIGDFAPIVVLAHEWGHHVQGLLGIPPRAGNVFELQADCLAGAYARDAGQRGLLDPGDITEAVAISARAGDPLGLPQDAPGSHGINDDRITAFMRGYLGGVEGCGLTGWGSRMTALFASSPSFDLIKQSTQESPADTRQEPIHDETYQILR